MEINIRPYKGKDELHPREKNMLFLSLFKMMKLQIKKGSPLLLTNTDGEIFVKACNSEELEGSDAVLPSFSIFGYYTKSKLSVEFFKSEVLDAEKVILFPEKYEAFMDSKLFLWDLKRKLDQLYVKEGMILTVNYIGLEYCLTVQKIFSNLPTEEELFQENKDVSLLENIFCEKCSLNKNFEFQSSTPISSPKIPVQSTPQGLQQIGVINGKNQKRRKKKRQNKIFFHVSQSTEILVADPDLQKKMKSDQARIIKIKDISGFEEYIADIESSITSVINQDTLDSLGILVIGPPGTGKSMLIEALQNEYADRLLIHNINSLISKSNNRDLTNISQKIIDRSPSLVLIDDVDKLCKNKKEQAEMYSFLRSLLIWNCSSDILVIATCQSDASVPENFLKRSLLDRKIEFSIPSPASRKQILINILKRFKSNLTEDQISEISDMAHGFTGSDLNRLCMEADCKRIERRTNNSRIIFIDFQQSFCNVKPSSVAEFSFKVPNVKWSDIGGMEEVKEAVKEMVEWPLKYPEKLKRFKLIPPRGILMYGPPGCCKTMIAKALANESHCNFIIVKQAEVFNKYVGESEKSISELFKKARAAAPCILFFDEIETIVPVRGSTHGSTNVSDRVVTQILLEIDGVDVLEQGVCVIAATNNPSKIDPSLLRPGRLDRLIYVPLPDAPTRKEIFRITLQNKPISSDVDLEYLVDRTENYTGAEISAVCTEACMCAMKEMLSNTSTNEELNSPILPVSMKHLLRALTYVQPRTTREMLNVFEEYRKKFKLQNFFM